MSSGSPRTPRARRECRSRQSGQTRPVSPSLLILTASDKKARIIPRHLSLAIRNDEELSKLLGDMTISQAGVLAHIAPQLLKVNPRNKKGTQSSSTTKDGVVESMEGEWKGPRRGRWQSCCWQSSSTPTAHRSWLWCSLVSACYPNTSERGLLSNRRPAQINRI